MGRVVTAARESGPLLEVRNLSKDFVSRTFPLVGERSVTQAVDDVSFTVNGREAFGLVGESGSGKTTIGRMVVRLVTPTSGSILFRGEAIDDMRGRRLLAYRRAVQMIFQSSSGQFNPRRRIRDVIADGITIHRLARGRELDARLARLMETVGLSPEMLSRYPHQFSGGQRQRIGIARALAVEPQLVIADEPVSALDVSVQAQVLNVLRALQRDLGLTSVFISHDLRAVAFICDRIGVLYLGRLVEVGERDALLTRPAHPYTQALISSVPALPREQLTGGAAIVGDIADEAPDRLGCVFAPRCELRARLGNPERCVTERPALRPTPSGTEAACHFVDESTAGAPAGVSTPSAAVAT
jgi:oligopeptide/dipeptide ABC transporter ATP-binding protein